MKRIACLFLLAIVGCSKEPVEHFEVKGQVLEIKEQIKGKPDNVPPGSPTMPVGPQISVPQPPYGILKPGTPIIDQSVEPEEVIEKVYKSRPAPPGPDNILRVDRIVNDLIFTEQTGLKGKTVRSDKKTVVEFTVQADNRTYRVSLSFSAEGQHKDGAHVFTDGVLKFLDVTRSAK